MSGPTNWWEVAFLACLPLLALILIFAWLIFVTRGRRAINIDLSGFGVTLRLGSSDSSATQRELTPLTETTASTEVTRDA